MKLHQFREWIDKIDDSSKDYDDKTVTVILSENSYPSTPSTEVVGISQGIDWDAYQIMLRTKDRIMRKKGI